MLDPLTEGRRVRWTRLEGKREENGWHVVLNLFDIVPKIISVNYFVVNT